MSYNEDDSLGEGHGAVASDRFESSRDIEEDGGSEQSRWLREGQVFSKEKIKFGKGAEQNISLELFRIAKVIERCLQPLYVLEDLNGTLIDGQFYQVEVTPFRVTRFTDYNVD